MAKEQPGGDGRVLVPTRPVSSVSTRPLLIAIAAGIAVWLLPLSLGPEVQRVLAVTMFMVIAWSTNAVDHAITGLLGCFAFWALGLAKFSVAFSGFSHITPWFLLGALYIGTMAAKSGLAKRLAYGVVRTVGTSYVRLLLGLVIADFLLTFIIPSGIARVVIMASMAIGLCEAFGVGRGSNIGRGMFLVLTYSATIFDKMIIAGAASMTARGLIHLRGGVDVSWSRWFVAFLPADLLTILVAWRLTLYLFPPEKHELPEGERFVQRVLADMGPWTNIEKRAAFLISCAIGLWVTDFLHGVSPALIGLGVGLLATVPVIGVLDRHDLRKVNYLPIFFVATAIGMGAVIDASGALSVLTNTLFGWMAPFVSNTLTSTLVLYWTAFAYHLPLGDEVAMLATSIPPLMAFAKTHQLDPLVVGMVWTFGAGGKMFVYQSAPLVVGYSYGYFRGRDLIKLGAILSVVESAILLLLVPLYWPLLGL